MNKHFVNPRESQCKDVNKLFNLLADAYEVDNADVPAHFEKTPEELDDEKMSVATGLGVMPKKPLRKLSDMTSRMHLCPDALEFSGV